jgi:lipopolysaccharide cholinephosphotransferase
MPLNNLFARKARDAPNSNIPTGRKHFLGEIHNIDVFFPPKSATFEGFPAYIPNNVNTYLEKLYGTDYMTPPPPEKRERHAFVKVSF